MEKREEPRYKIDAAAEVRYGTNTIDARAVEISAHGVRIESTSSLKIGIKVEVTLFFKKPERFFGKVQWVFTEVGKGGLNYKMGIYCEEGGLITDNGP